MQLSPPGKLAIARDARALTFAIKDLEAKLGPLKVNTTAKGGDKSTSKDGDESRDTAKGGDEIRDTADKNESTGSPSKEVNSEDSQTAKRESSGSPSKCNDSKEKLVESPTRPSVQLDKNEKSTGSPAKEVNSNESPTAKRESVDSPSKCNNSKEKLVESPTGLSVQLESQANNKDLTASENLKESSLGRGDGEMQMKNSSEEKVSQAMKDEHVTSPPVEKEENTYSVAKRDGHDDLESSSSEDESKKSSN